MITNTDNELQRFPIKDMLAPTMEKIEFINNSHIIDDAYKMLVECKPNPMKLHDSAMRLHDTGLGMILNKFYNNDWRVKDGFSK